MPAPRQEEDDDDLYEDDFEFVDDDDDDLIDEADDEEAEEDSPAPKKRAAKKTAAKPAKSVKKKAAPKKRAPRKKAKPPEDQDREEQAPADEVPEDKSPEKQTPADTSVKQDAGADPVVAEGGEDLDEFGRPKPLANYVVHVYELGSYRRTIDRDFTPEDAEGFATEYNKTAKPYNRRAISGKKETTPPKTMTKAPPKTLG
jgi:hypothetical protein